MSPLKRSAVDDDSISDKPPGDWGRLLTEHVVMGEAFEALIDAITRGDGKLPLLPPVALELLELANKPDVPFDTIARKAVSDPTVASRIMALASSPAYGGRAPPGLKEALARIGLEGVRYVAWDLAFQSRVMRRGPLLEVVDKSVRHARLMSAIARILAKPAGLDPSTASLTGLMHGLGAIVITDALGERKLKRPLPAPLVILSVRVLHAWVAARTAVRMNIPLEVCKALEVHHKPGARKLAQLLCLADLLAPHEPGQRMEPPKRAVALAGLQLDPDAVAKALEPLQLGAEVVHVSDDEKKIMAGFG